MRQHTECEGTMTPCNKGEHDLAWGNPTASYWKLKNPIITRIKELCDIQDGCSTRAGIIASDDKLYWCNYPYNMRLEVGEQIELTPTTNFPSRQWKVERI